MKKIFLSAAALIFLFAACKKSSSSSTSIDKTKLIGTWMRTYTATDLNNNGSIDASEKTPLSSGDYEYMTYKSDGTGLDSFNSGFGSGTSAIVWSVTANWLTLNLSGFGTEISQVTQLDDHNLILLDTSRHPAVWGIFAK